MKMLLLMLSVLFLKPCFGQQGQLDSLEQLFNSYSDHAKLDSLESWLENPNHSIELYATFFLKHQDISDAILSPDQSKFWKGKCHVLCADRFAENLTLSDQSLFHLEEIVRIARGIKDRKLKNELSIQSNFILGKVHQSQYTYHNAYNSYLQAYELALEEEHELLLELCRRLSLVVYPNDNYTKRIYWLEEALSLAEKQNEKGKPFVDLQIQLALIYLQNTSFKKSRALYEKYLPEMEKLNFSESFKVFSRLRYYKSLVYTGEVKRGLKLIEALKVEIDKIHDPFLHLLHCQGILECWVAIGDMDQAKKEFARYKELLWEDEAFFVNKSKLETLSGLESLRDESYLERIAVNQKIQDATFRNQITGLLFLGLTLISILGIYLYYSRNKKNQLELIALKDIEIVKQRNRLFSSISHDIKTPLALVMGPLDRVCQRIENIEIKKLLSNSLVEGDKLLRIVTKILDLNKAEAGVLVLNQQTGNLQLVINAIVNRMMIKAKMEGVVLNTEMAIPKGQFLLDFDKLEKIIYHIFDNAMNSSKKDSEILLNLSLLDELHLNIQVLDCGSGMSKKDLPSAFESYFQSDSADKRSGSILGLSLSKELIELMGGEITVRSELGKGTKVNITIPVERISVGDVLVNENSTDENVELVKILLVEDDLELREFLHSALGSNKYDVQQAESAGIALELLKSFHPDLVLADWNLGDASAGWLMDEMANIPEFSFLPILILSGENEAEIKQEAMAKGAIAWMSKPFRVELLKDQIDNIWKHQEAIKMNFRQDTSDQSNDNRDSWNPTADPFLAQVLLDINENISNEKYSVEMMAKNLKLHRVKLSKKIKKLIDSRPAHLILDIRLKKAKALLKKPNASVSSVAYAVGYSNPNYFSTVYKKFYGTLPSSELKKAG